MTTLRANWSRICEYLKPGAPFPGSLKEWNVLAQEVPLARQGPLLYLLRKQGLKHAKLEMSFLKATEKDHWDPNLVLQYVGVQCLTHKQTPLLVRWFMAEAENLQRQQALPIFQGILCALVNQKSHVRLAHEFLAWSRSLAIGEPDWRVDLLVAHLYLFETPKRCPGELTEYLRLDLPENIEFFRLTELLILMERPAPCCQLDSDLKTQLWAKYFGKYSGPEVYSLSTHFQPEDQEFYQKPVCNLWVNLGEALRLAGHLSHLRLLANALHAHLPILHIDQIIHFMGTLFEAQLRMEAFLQMCMDIAVLRLRSTQDILVLEKLLHVLHGFQLKNDKLVELACRLIERRPLKEAHKKELTNLVHLFQALGSRVPQNLEPNYEEQRGDALINQLQKVPSVPMSKPEQKEASTAEEPVLEEDPLVVEEMDRIDRKLIQALGRNYLKDGVDSSAAGNLKIRGKTLRRIRGRKLSQK